MVISLIESKNFLIPECKFACELICFQLVHIRTIFYSLDRPEVLKSITYFLVD